MNLKIHLNSLISFIILWGTPSVMVAGTYLKMDKDERCEVLENFKSLHFISTINLLVIGAFLTSLGNLVSINTLKYVGIILFAVAGVISGVIMWKKSKLRSVIITLFVTGAIAALA